MNENEWVSSIVPAIREALRALDPQTDIVEGEKLPYAHEIRRYRDGEPHPPEVMKFETDILVVSRESPTEWTPRVVIEAKYHGSITTHDAITYSEKAEAHRTVHPYLRYGILLGERETYPLPGRLFRHGTQFDFMMSWAGSIPTENEQAILVAVLAEEVKTSRRIEEIMYDTRSRERKTFTLLHRHLKLE